MQDTDSFKLLTWQEYLTGINLKCIFGDIIEIPTDTYQVHKTVLNIKENARGSPSSVGGVGWKRLSSPRVKGILMLKQ